MVYYGGHFVINWHHNLSFWKIVNLPCSKPPGTPDCIFNKKKKAFFSSADMSAEVWDQASGQNHELQVENELFDLALSQQEAHPPSKIHKNWPKAGHRIQ